MESYSSIKTQSWLSWFLRGVIILGVLILLARLIELQVIKGKYFRSLAEGNRIREVIIFAPRGEILARGGEVLVGSSEVLKRVVFDPNEGYEKLQDVEGASVDEVITEWKREYLLKEAFAHASGYLGEANAEEVGSIDGDCPEKGPRKLGSLIGRSGLEEEYECKLRGIDGEELIEVDTSGKKVRVLGKRDVIPGESIKTTINYGLQQEAARLFEGKKGAVVVTDAKGEVLALYSSPSYDPNIFLDEGKKDKTQAILTDTDLPLFNRAMGGLYHPGSVFKPVVAVAALEEGTIDSSYVYDDPGVITIDSIYGKFSYSNWYFTQYGRKEGVINLPRAITRSTDTFFYKLGELVGIEKLDYWAGVFRLDKKTGIDLPGEIAGLVPDPEWKLRVRGERWFLGNTYHMSIGQGDIALTPLGVNQAISAIAANGIYCNPRLVLGEDEKQRCTNLGIKSETIELVKEGMKGVCSTGGTAFPFFDFEQKAQVTVACKTGTAETEEKDKTHAWLSVFAPADSPEIVATVMVEKGGEGSYVAAPIAREIFNFWYQLEPKNSQNSAQ